ncbi:hypothetical protein K439DRAFT_1660774 [Ramaria rubella]|nr:hypothetical protein K439DRAFT_1660774 [Ramaria rubella]
MSPSSSSSPEDSDRNSSPYRYTADRRLTTASGSTQCTECTAVQEHVEPEVDKHKKSALHSLIGKAVLWSEKLQYAELPKGLGDDHTPARTDKEIDDDSEAVLDYYLDDESHSFYPFQESPECQTGYERLQPSPRPQMIQRRSSSPSLHSQRHAQRESNLTIIGDNHPVYRALKAESVQLWLGRPCGGCCPCCGCGGTPSAELCSELTGCSMAMCCTFT